MKNQIKPSLVAMEYTHLYVQTNDLAERRRRKKSKKRRRRKKAKKRRKQKKKQKSSVNCKKREILILMK